MRRWASLRWSVALLATTMLAACGVDLPDPQPTSASPSFGWNGQDTLVTIGGDHFYPKVEVDATGRDGTVVTPLFEASLVDASGKAYPLDGVTLEDYHHLQAVVPGGYPAGTYDLVVTGPAGGQGELDGAFTVTDTLADHLTADVEDGVSFKVFETAWLDLSVADPDGGHVLTDVPVVVTVTSEDGDVAATFTESESDPLEDAEPLSTGDGVRGGLGGNGRARIGITVGTPELVTVTVADADAHSGVSDGSIKLEWRSEEAAGLDIALPDEPLGDDGQFQATAGVPFPVKLTFVDAFGNPAEHHEPVLLVDSCGRFWSDPIDIDTSATVDLTMKVASTTDCPDDRLEVLFGPSGESAPFTVASGPLDRFQVDVSPGQKIVAGNQLFASVTPVDAYGNQARWDGTQLLVSDDVGGIGAFSCVPTSPPIICSAHPQVAGDAIHLVVQGDDGTSGQSDNTYAVVAGAPTDMDVVVRTSSATAGSPVATAVTVYDAYGNIVDASAFGSGTFSFADDGGPVSCVPTGVSSSGVAAYDCTFTLATTGDQLVATMPSRALSATSTSFDVVNGPLAEVDVTPSATAVVAGQSVLFTFAGYDAWGNPYAVAPKPAIDVTDSTGTLGFTTVTLTGKGTASAMGSITRSGRTVVTASQGGVSLGSSAAIDVAPSSPASLSVSDQDPWVWTGVTTTVRIDAIDTYGNRTDVDASGKVTSSSGAFSTQSVTLVDGSASIALVYSSPVTNETVSASSGTLSGSTKPFSVVTDCGSTGPTASLAFGGASEAVACWDATSEQALLSASFSGSTAGSAALSRYEVAVDGEPVSRSTSSTVAAVAGQVGVVDVSGLVVDQSGCADEVSTVAWVGPDDGSAVGPLDVSLGASSIAAGTGSTTIDVTGATDCSGDPAAGATVHLWTDRGDVTGATPTGTGLAIALDAAGDGSATLDATGVTTGGAATVTAWVDSLAASGTASATITGDNRKPVVWDQSPSGDVTSPVSSVVLTFSEPLLTSTVVKANFGVSGPAAASISSVTASTKGDQATVAFASPLDPTLGTWTLTVSSAVRDAAGNKLDGARTGMASTYTGTFGDLPSAASPVASCAADTDTLRPDGDDGAGDEADHVYVDVATAALPAYWVVSVEDASGTLVWRDFVAPIAATDVLEWDGRGVDEAIVANGAYTLTVDSDDGFGNRGGSCSVTSTVDNRTGD